MLLAQARRPSSACCIMPPGHLRPGTDYARRSRVIYPSFSGYSTAIPPMGHPSPSRHTQRKGVTRHAHPHDLLETCRHHHRGRPGPPSRRAPARRIRREGLYDGLTRPVSSAATRACSGPGQDSGRGRKGRAAGGLPCDSRSGSLPAAAHAPGTERAAERDTTMVAAD